MSERIEGLSIGLDLDTLKLDSGLTSLKSKLSLVNSEMRANLSAFDRGDKSVDRYQTRIDGLNKKLEVQKAVVDSAQKSYEKMVKEHGEGSEQAEKAARNYNHEVAALSNLERQISKTKAELKQLTQEQKIADSGWTKTGDSLINFGNRLSTISERSKELGRNLTRSITMPAVGAASALAGITIAKGFGRLVGIDTARAKLVGLGHDAEGVENIMTSALDSVRGTAFGLDEAATTAANAVAAGVKEGEELTRYLKITGDAAAIAGAGLGEMGSIFNKVQTAQKAYTGDLNMLSDRGIPIYQWLAEEAETTAEKVRDMASDGAVSSEMFLNAIEKNIGGAAQKMGEESFTAGIANMWAAVGRLGASFLDAGGEGGGFFSQMKPLIADFTGRLDDMGDIAERAGVKFGEMFTGFLDRVKSVKSWYDELSPTMQNFINKTAIVGTAIAVSVGPALVALGTLGSVLAKVSIVFGSFFKWIGKAKVIGVFGKNIAGGTKQLGLFSRILTALTGPVGWVIGLISLLAAGFVTAYKRSEPLRKGISMVGESFRLVYDEIKTFLSTNPQIISFFDNLKRGLDWGVGALKKTGEVFVQAFDFTVDRIGIAIQKFNQLFMDGFTLVVPFLESLVGSIAALFRGDFKDAFKILGEGFLELFTGFKKLLDDYFGDITRKTLSRLGDLGKSIVNWFKELPKRIINAVSGAASAASDWLATARDNSMKKLGEWKDSLIVWLSSLPDLISGKLSEWGKRFDNFLKEQDEENKRQYSEWGKTIIEWFNSIPDRITEAFDNWKVTIVGNLKSTGESIKNGITEWGTVISEWFSDRITSIKVGLSNWWSSISGWFTETKTSWSDNLSSWTTSITNWFVELPSKTKVGLTNWFNNTRQSIINWKDNFVGSFNSWWEGLKNWFTGLGKKKEVKNTGKEIIKSVVNGAKEEEASFMERLGEILLNGILYALGAIAIMALALGREIISRVIQGMKSLWGSLSNVFSDLVTLGTRKLQELVNKSQDRMAKMRDDALERMTGMKDGVTKRITDMRIEAVRRFNVMKDRFFEVGRDIKNNITDRFDDMVQAAKDLPGRIGDGIKNMASKATSGVKSFANSIGSTLETGVNKVIGGMNTLLNNIGVSLRIPDINIPAYATGTKNHPGGPAVVGEEGRELAHIPGKGYTMLGIDGAELLNLPKGSSVLPNKETERLLVDGMGLPGYKTGVGRAFDWVKGKAQSGWQNMKNLASDAVGWLLDAPRKLFEKAMNFVGVSMPKASDFPGAFMRGGFTKLREGIEEKLKGVQGEVLPTSPTFGPPFRMTSPFGWRTHPVLGTRRFHSGIDYAAPIGTPLLSQSAGRVSFSGWMGGYGNTVMVKSGIFDHLYAHNSRNVARSGQSVSKGQLLALVGSTGMSTGPHVHYEVRKNGKAINPKGFKTGGLIKEKMMALLGDGGYPEYVIPTDPARATDAMKLLALAGRDIESRGGAKRPHQLPNVPGGSDRIDKLEKLMNDILDFLADQGDKAGIVIEKMIVRSEEDIKKIALELERLKRRRKRS